MGAALAAKRGAKTFPAAQKIATQMTESQLEDFARKPKAPAQAKQPKTYL
jgi:hypothetical protein